MLKIIVRGGGDLATGVIHRLWGAGFKVLVLECGNSSTGSAVRGGVSGQRSGRRPDCKADKFTA
mgnify:CR=1 FL=1